jgi:hypothetical protein
VGAEVDETDAEIEQVLVFLRRVEAVRDPCGVQDSPEAVAWVGVMVSGLARGERRVVPAEQEVQAWPQEVYGHRA